MTVRPRFLSNYMSVIKNGRQFTGKKSPCTIAQVGIEPKLQNEGSRTAANLVGALYFVDEKRRSMQGKGLTQDNIASGGSPCCHLLAPTGELCGANPADAFFSQTWGSRLIGETRFSRIFKADRNKASRITSARQAVAVESKGL